MRAGNQKATLDECGTKGIRVQELRRKEGKVIFISWKHDCLQVYTGYLV